MILLPKTLKHVTDRQLILKLSNGTVKTICITLTRCSLHHIIIITHRLFKVIDKKYLSTERFTSGGRRRRK